MRVLLAMLFLTSAVHADVGKQAIRREVKRHLMKVLACYEMHGQLQSRVVLHFVIGASGRVTAVRASGAGDKPLQDCILGVFKRMTFPPSRDATKVTYPIQICTAGQ